MLQIRQSSDRGHADHGWLKSMHTFSFADYYDPNFMGFRSLRVINEDRIEGGTGFGAHSHRDMEIVSYVLEGTLKHQDSNGNARELKTGEVQVMSAGKGIVHSEMNADANLPAHFLQIWIQPETRGTEPSYEQKSFAQDLATKGEALIASPDGRDGSLKIGQQAEISLGQLPKGGVREIAIHPKRGIWLQVVRGQLTVNTQTLTAGDGVAAQEIDRLHLQALEACEWILFELS